MTHRSPGAVAAIAVLLATAACSTGSAGSAGTTTGATQPLAPLQGAFATVALPTGVQSLQAVDCPTTLRCWAVGSTVATAQAPSTATVVTTGNGGATWRTQTVPAGVTYLTGIACSDVRTCTAVGQVETNGSGMGAIITTLDGGRTWTLQSVPTGTTDVTAVACPPAGPCMALGYIAGRETTLSAASTVAVPPTSLATTPTSTPASTSTSTPASGWVAGGALPATVSSATGLTCTDTGHCWATVMSLVDIDHASGGVVATADGGVTWTPETLPTGTGALQGIDCTPATTTAAGTTTSTSSPAVDCVAVGTTATAFGAVRSGQGVVLTSSTGGATWSPPDMIPFSSDMFAVSCGAGPCVAVGTTMAAIPESGLVVVAGSTGSAGAWERARTNTLPLPLAGVSCASLSTCVVVGESIAGHLASDD